MNIEFVGELPDKKPVGRPPDPVLVEFAAALRENPGVWAKYPTPLSLTGVSQVAGAIRKAKAPAPAALRTGFDAVGRSGVLYVRYIGVS